MKAVCAQEADRVSLSKVAFPTKRLLLMSLNRQE